MAPIGAKAAPAGAAPNAVTRMAYLYFPNGVPDGTWQPERVAPSGQLQKLNESMAPLERFKGDLVIPKRVWTPRGNGHGAGTATWLTGGRYDGRRIDAGGISADQLAAKHIGKETPVPSLDLSTQGEGYFSGSLPRNCISWTESNIPASRESGPRNVFDRMFRKATEGKTDQSVLDIVLSQAKELRRNVSNADQQKLDEYLDSLRAVEKRMEFAEQQSTRANQEGILTDTLQRPKPGIPANHQEHIRQLMDMMALGFWANATRVSTFMLDHGQSNRYFNFVDGVEGTWHALSHYKDINGKTEDDDGKTAWSSLDSKRDMYSAVTRWHHEQFAYFLDRLTNLKDADGSSVLDNTMILYGSSLADGHGHDEKNLPLIIAGRGAGTIKTGRSLPFKKDTSMSEIHLAFLRGLGIEIDRFGGSEQTLPGLAG